MNEYIEEAEDVSFDSSLGESYDHEQALVEMGEKQGSIEEKKKIAKSLLEENIDINIVSKTTGLSIEELKEIQKLM